MIDWEAERRKRKKRAADNARKWNKNNSNKITNDGTVVQSTKGRRQKGQNNRVPLNGPTVTDGTVSKKSAPKKNTPTVYDGTVRTGGKNKTGTSSGNYKTPAPKQNRATKQMRKQIQDRQKDYAFYRAELGLWNGAVNATTGFNAVDPNDEKLKNSKAFKAGNIAGQMAGYGLGYGGVGKVTGKAAGKVITSKTGKKLISKTAKSKLFKNAAKKTLTKQGQNATKKAIEHKSKQQAKKFVESATKNIIADATIGTAMDSNVARAKGYKVGSDEWKKEMAVNAALNLGVGGAAEIAPTVIKAIGKNSAKKPIAKIVNGKIKNVKVTPKKIEFEKPKTYKTKAKAPISKYQKQKFKAVNTVSNRPSIRNARAVNKISGNLEAQKKQFDELFNEELAKHSDYIRNYEKKGTTTNFNPDKNRLEMGWDAGDGFGYSTRSSNNDQWYQKAFDERGRAPNKSEAGDIAREHLMKDLEDYLDNPNSVGDMELGASDELKELYRSIVRGEGQVDSIKGYSGKNLDEAISDESFGKIMSDNDFADALLKQYGSPEGLAKTAKDNGINVNDFIDMKREEFDVFHDLGDSPKFNRVDQTMDNPMPKKAGIFDVETSNGIISPEFKAVGEMMEDGKGLFRKTYQALVSGQSELERFAKASGKTRVLDSSQAVRSAQGTVNHIVGHGIVDTAGKVIEKKSYIDLMSEIPKDKRKLFNTYAQHLHNIDRWAQDKPVFFQTSADESRKIVDDILKDNPEFEKISSSITDWWNKFTKTWLLDTGRMTQEAYNAMLAKYPHYIPTYRVGKTHGVGGGMPGRVNPGQAVKGAVGGSSEVIPVEDSLLAEINRIVSSTRKNDLYSDLIDELASDPQKFKQYGVVVGNTDAIKPDDFLGLLDEAERTGLKEVNDKVAMITAYRDGKAVSAYINKNIYDSLKLLDDAYYKDGSRKLHDVGAKITNPVKAGITGLNPLFAVSNAMRDLPTLFIQSNYNPLKTTSNIGKAVKQMVTKGDIYEIYKAVGGENAGYYSQGKGFSDVVAKSHNPIKRTWDITKTILSAIGEGTETIPRLAEFIGSIEKYGTSREGVMKALRDSAEVTVDFSRSGPLTKTLDGWTLYLNAAVQGLDKFARTVKAHPFRTTARGMSVITLPYAALMAYNWDNPNYQDLNDRTKQNFFCIPNMLGEKDINGKPMTFIKVPVNREYGAILGSSLDVIAGMIEGEENPFKGYGETLKTNFMPPSPLTDNILSPIVQNLPNNKDFAGRDIVPANLADASAINQKDVTTSGAAEYLARLTNNISDRTKLPLPETLKSPKKIDYLIDSYGGYLGQVLKSATSGEATDAKSFLVDTMGKNTIADPFAKRFTADARYSSGVIQDFYDEKDKVARGKKDAELEGRGATADTVKSKVYDEIAKELSALTKEEKEILANKSIPKAQREKQIKAIRLKRNELARSAKRKAEVAEREYKSAPNFAVLDKNIKEKYNKNSGVSKETFAKVYNSRKNKDGKIEQGTAGYMNMANNGITYDQAKALYPDLSRESWNRAKNLASVDITPDKYKTIKDNANYNGNSCVSKDEAMAYLATTNYSRKEKEYIFAVLCPTVKYNPYV